MFLLRRHNHSSRQLTVYRGGPEFPGVHVVFEEKVNLAK